VIEPNQRLERALAAFVRQDFGAPIATITGLTEILIEDAQRNGDDLLVSDLDRIHAAGLLLQEQLSRLVDLATQNPFEFAGDFGAFKAKLRHDLRTPLNAVKGYGELIIEDARDNGREDLLADIGKLMDAADQLLGRIDKLFGVTDDTIDRPWDEMATQTFILVAAVELHQIAYFHGHMLRDRSHRRPVAGWWVSLDPYALQGDIRGTDLSSQLGLDTLRPGHYLLARQQACDPPGQVLRLVGNM